MALPSAYLHRLLGRITAPIAMAVGNLREKDGDTAGARVAYQHAVDTGHKDWAPCAWHDLGDLLKDQGDTEGARDAYRNVFVSGTRRVLQPVPRGRSGGSVTSSGFCAPVLPFAPANRAPEAGRTGARASRPESAARAAPEAALTARSPVRAWAPKVPGCFG